MDFSLSEDQEALRRQIIEFAHRELNSGIHERDGAHEFPRGLWLECGRLGLQGLPVPEQYGGAGLDPLSTALAMEAFGYGCEDGGLVFSVGAHLLACVVPILSHGSEEQKRRYLPGLANGTLIAANAMTEPDSGSDAFSMSTTAEPDGDGFLIRGTKTFCTNGPVCDLAVVYAATDRDKGFHGGTTVFVVETGTAGFSVGQRFEKLGLRTSPISELLFDDVRVPGEAVVGRVGAGGVIFNESMEWERICLPAAHIGTIERLLERSLEYARTRRAFGQPIARFQAVSHRIVDMKVRLEAARLLTYRAAGRIGQRRDVGMDASMTKLFVSESLVTSALDAIRLFGGYGFMQEYDVERALRDAVGSTLYSGTSEMQRNIIAAWLGL